MKLVQAVIGGFSGGKPRVFYSGIFASIKTLNAANMIKEISVYKEYKILHVVEGGCGTILLGSSGLPLKKMETTLNEEAAQGWQVVFQVVERKRFWLFWNREAVILTLGR